MYMSNNIRKIAVIACLALPFGLLGSSTHDTSLSPNLAKKIKKAVAKDQGLQPASRNVEVTVEKNVVTLKGTVQSEVDSQAVLGTAEDLVIQDTPSQLINSGEFQIENQLVVAPQ
jgi:hypothetical protein